ncbi:MAG: hypothetical protein IJY79_01615 [Clostridia bacterium]|nr:hypothetical protein [Clostridia bacterium]
MSGITIGKKEQKTLLNIAVVTSNSSNDLLNTLKANYSGISEFLSLDDALNDVSTNKTNGIMVLGDNYPDLTTEITAAQAERINELGIRLYVEYPSVNNTLGIIDYNGTKTMGYDRAVVTDCAAVKMKKHSILYVHGAQLTVKTDIGRSWLVGATVAGYDTADFGLTDCTPYSLLEVNQKGNVLIAATKLSGFISARYAPYTRWQKLWLGILSWLSQSDITHIEWTPAVTPQYDKTAILAADAYNQAVGINAEWYIHNMLVNPDGTGGFYQCYNSGNNFGVRGEQSLNKGVRADCTGESIGAIALAGVILNNDTYRNIAHNAMNWMLNESEMANGDRADPTSSQYGLLSWYNDQRYLKNYYGDDNAKAILGLILGASALGTHEFDKRILEAILGNFRTTGTNGFRGAMLKGEELDNYGWEAYFNRYNPYYSYSPHFEALLWACYLWAYDKTRYEPLLERTLMGISSMMTAYANTMSNDKPEGCAEWKWTNGMQQERAKMIWPLAWLVRLEPTKQHINWLDTMIADMMKYQDAVTGALRDAFGERNEGSGSCGPFTKNSEYGTHESPVIQNNGDPCSDSLYTASFAMVTLNEAYAAMVSIGNSVLAEKYKKYAKMVSDYHIRIQQKSDNAKYNGVWFRGFDYEKWETYGSDGDAGWGIWCTETGWSQAQISSALSLQVLNTNVWDYTATTTIDSCFKDVAAVMLNYHFD